jgi:hypothetical protein
VGFELMHSEEKLFKPLRQQHVMDDESDENHINLKHRLSLNISDGCRCYGTDKQKDRQY